MDRGGGELVPNGLAALPESDWIEFPMTQEKSSTTETSERHNALVVPMSDGYAVSCSCGWAGGKYDEPEPAERAAERHEADRTGKAEGSQP